jgi:hypothetical protein
MQFKFIATIFALALVTGAASVSADSERNGNLHAAKECSQYTGAAGDFCTFTSSNLAEIKVGSKLFYDQADGIPNCSKSSPPCPASGLLDSNVVLYVGTGDWARGRCTLDDGTGLGLCRTGPETWPASMPVHRRLPTPYRSGMPLGRDVQLRRGRAAIRWQPIRTTSCGCFVRPRPAARAA